ncbi:hypothetical protein ACFQT0_02805 [Hymenobacter humi]|uniref:DUF3333 domain-containing protein n=1 Tax=Hymenobacter humi TaxID=1411620 RepID=A0ABW2TZ30_9BACT
MPTSSPARRPKPLPLKPARKGRFTAFTRTMWVLFGAGIVGMGLFVAAVSGNFLNLFGRMPNLKTLENPRSEPGLRNLLGRWGATRQILSREPHARRVQRPATEPD